jgi:hypothetical protein
MTVEDVRAMNMAQDRRLPETLEETRSMLLRERAGHRAVTRQAHENVLQLRRQNRIIENLRIEKAGLDRQLQTKKNELETALRKADKLERQLDLSNKIRRHWGWMWQDLQAFLGCHTGRGPNLDFLDGRQRLRREDEERLERLTNEPV